MTSKAMLVRHLLESHPELVHPRTQSALMGWRKEELESTHERLHKADQTLAQERRERGECPGCGRVMSNREAAEQCACNECAAGRS